MYLQEAHSILNEVVLGGIKGWSMPYVGGVSGGVIGAVGGATLGGSVGGPLGFLVGSILGGEAGAAIGSRLMPYIFTLSVQKRINSFYYECKNIKDKQERMRCQCKLLTFIINTLKSYSPKDNSERKRINKAIIIYKTRLNKLSKKLNNKNLDEAASNFGWKTVLFGSTLLGAFSEDKIKELSYHCNEIDDLEERSKCRHQLAMKIKEIKNKK